MKCELWASLLARTFASPYLGYKPKARVATLLVNHVKNFNYTRIWSVDTWINKVVIPKDLDILLVILKLQVQGLKQNV
jgi:hypothetical protein